MTGVNRSWTIDWTTAVNAAPSTTAIARSTAFARRAKARNSLNSEPKRPMNFLDFIFIASRWRDSNPRPDDYKSPALPDCATPAWKSKVSEIRLASICRLRRMSESSQPHHSASPPGSHYQPALSVVLIIVVLFVAAAFLMLRYVNPAGPTTSTTLPPSQTTTTTH